MQNSISYQDMWRGFAGDYFVDALDLSIVDNNVGCICRDTSRAGPVTIEPEVNEKATEGVKSDIKIDNKSGKPKS